MAKPHTTAETPGGTSMDFVEGLIKALDEDQPDWLERWAHPQDKDMLLRVASRQPASFAARREGVKVNTAKGLMGVIYAAYNHGLIKEGGK